MNVIILAAGKGTRMKSDKLKVMHKIGARPIISYVLDTVFELDINSIYMIIGHQSEELKKFVPDNTILVEQKEQLGTGHAVMQAEKFFKKESNSTVLVLPGDCPLIRSETLNKLFSLHQQEKADASILTTTLDEPGSYGRILRGETGLVHGIREAKDCCPAELSIKEINTGIYLFSSKILFESLKKITTNNKQGEYYLTDVIEIMVKAKNIVVAYCTKDTKQTSGINTRKDLVNASKYINHKVIEEFLENGVTILDPDTTYIESGVKIGKDVEISPFTVIKGNTVIEDNCYIGEHCFLQDCTIKKGQHLNPYTNLVENK